MPAKGYAIVSREGNIRVNIKHILAPMEWVYILGHCLLHLGLGHFKKPREQLREWNAACDTFVTRFLQDIKLAPVPYFMSDLPQNLPDSEEKLYREILVRGNIPEDMLRCGTAGPDFLDMDFEVPKYAPRYKSEEWEKKLAYGISDAVNHALGKAAGIDLDPITGAQKKTKSAIARDWFINSYPLLGALAASFEIIEDIKTCQTMGIQIAAVDDEIKKIYVNPLANLSQEESKFVIAHEILHASLRHSTRRQGRDPYLWNVSCDYVIDGWLKEMQVGEMPRYGLLYDPTLRGLSAESVYDLIVTDLRRARKLMTFRGQGVGDMLGGSNPDWWSQKDGVDLDEFYRNSLAQGLIYHEANNRGYLPVGLVEEIQAQAHPPVPWDVELAQWFDGYFAPLEKFRTYARPSRRQSSTPDIPRASWIQKINAEDARTFGVVLDTSLSMSRGALGKALGAIANYCISREVPFVRVVFCDAAPYDEGYLSPDMIAHRVRVKGRGGTVLQPGIDVLEKADNFPKDGPILIITDGFCEEDIRVRREHAFLIPLNASLPFIPKGKVIRMDYKIPKPEKVSKS
jgi:predicted metal-dependent peptidase